jgi:hypothetical protein
VQRDHAVRMIDIDQLRTLFREHGLDWE